MTGSAFGGTIGCRSLYGSHGKQRVSIGMTNRREQFSAASEFNASFNNVSQHSMTLGSTRSESRLSGHAPFDLRTSLCPSPSPHGAASQLHGSVDLNNSSANVAMDMADALHNRLNRSLTPEAFFFGSRSVGAAGQLVKDRVPLHARSHSSISTFSSASRNNASTRPVPLPNHAELLSGLTNVRSSTSGFTGSATPIPCVGSAGLLQPTTTLDVSAKSLALSSKAETGENRHLAATPHRNVLFGAQSPSPQTHSFRSELLAARSPSSHDSSTYELNKYTPQQRHFFVSTAGKDNPRAPSTMPDLPDEAKPKLRYELTDYHNTSYVTQAPENAGQHSSEAQRFSYRDRGLGSSLVPQLEQAKAHTADALKAERRRDAEARVIKNCVERDVTLPNRKETYTQARHSVAVAAYRIQKANLEAAIRRQEDADAQSAACVNRFRESPGATH